MAKDIFHDAVVVALQNEGWTITHDPYTISPGEGIEYKVDLGAERIIVGAERGNEKIAVEIKSFIGLYNKYVDRGFTVIAINNGEPAPDVLRFVKDYELTFPVWLDPTYIATEQAFKTVNLPSSFVIDRNGTVRLMWVGGINKKMLDKYVPAIITEKP